MSESAWEVGVGLDAVFYPYLINNNRPITTYTGSESVRCKIWQGDDTAEMAGVVTVTFDATMATTGKTTATVNGSATSALTPGFYKRRCEIQLGGKWHAYDEGWLSLTDSPGAATVSTTYCTLQDMLDAGGSWVTGLLSTHGRSNFIAERIRAKNYIDKVILSRCRPSAGEGSNYLVSYAYSSPLYGAEDYDPYVKGLLDAGTALMQDAELAAMAAYYALSLACEKANTWDPGDPYQARARFCRAKFNQLCLSYVARFDTNADGESDLAINLGRFSTR